MGFTQGQAAAILGYLPATSLSQYERGRKLPNLLTALKLEIVYRVPVSFLFPEVYAELKTELREREERLRADWDRRCRGTAN
jgi:transcriptional regulator with XRE-family HTH domain